MSNEPERQTLPDSASSIERIEIEPASPVDWSTALRELEDAEPSAPSRPEQPLPPQEAAARPSYIPRPPRKAPVIADGTPPSDELSEVLTSVNSALNQLKRFESAHRAFIAPNIFRVWEDSLRETATVMTREYRRLRESDLEEKQSDGSADADHAVGEDS